MNLRTALTLSILFAMFFSLAKADPLNVGDKAPAVSGITDSGETLNLAELYKKSPYTLVWFYPKALTGGCTKQGCSLRDASAELKKYGVAVVGVSTDPVEKQKEFKETNNFPFPLIADTEKTVVKAFGQSGAAMASREAYLINREGVIVYKDQKQTEKQAENVLNYLAAQKK